MLLLNLQQLLVFWQSHSGSLHCLTLFWFHFSRHDCASVASSECAVCIHWSLSCVGAVWLPRDSDHTGRDWTCSRLQKLQHWTCRWQGYITVYSYGSLKSACLSSFPSKKSYTVILDIFQYSALVWISTEPAHNGKSSGFPLVPTRWCFPLNLSWGSFKTTMCSAWSDVFFALALMRSLNSDSTINVMITVILIKVLVITEFWVVGYSNHCYMMLSHQNMIRQHKCMFGLQM